MTTKRSGSVTTIIPTYNRVDLLPFALRSALEQTKPPDQVVVVDDGSTDGTADYLEHEVKDPRVEWLRHTSSRGPSAARNAGIRSSTSDYIAFLDSDDLWHPRKLEHQIRALERSQADFAYSGAFAFRESSLVGPYGRTFAGRSGNIFSLVLRANPVVTPTLIVRARMFEKVGVFDESLELGEDTALFLRLAQRGTASYAARPLAFIREHPGRMTGESNVGKKRRLARDRLLCELLADLECPQSRRDRQRTLHRLAEHRIAHYHEGSETLALDELVPADLDDARKALLVAYLSVTRPWMSLDSSLPLRAYWSIRLGKSGALSPGPKRVSQRHRSARDRAAIVAVGAGIEAARLMQRIEHDVRGVWGGLRARRTEAQAVLNGLTRQ